VGANHEEPIKVVKTKKSLKLLLSLNLRNGCLLLGWEPTSMLKVKLIMTLLEKFLKSVIKMVKFAEI
jgi:hypothetical protein